MDEDDDQNKEQDGSKKVFTLDENGNKVYNLREMSDLEKQYFQEARKRHRQNLTKPQIVMGKEFTGKAFLSKPEKIIFKDFDVGELYSQTIYLTNVSNSFNSFKLLPLKESIRDFFEIIYTPPGRMSAGMSCPITIRFHPQVKQDIDDVFPLLCETGPVDIVLTCTCKKAKVVCPEIIVDFEKVINGEEKIMNLKLVNQGALPTDLVIKSEKGMDIMTKTETLSASGSIAKDVKQDQDNNTSYNLESCLKQLKFQKINKIGGYSTLLIPIKYAPTSIGPIELPLMVYFDNFLHSPPISIKLKGECIEVPISVAQPVYNLEICLLNHIYREKIIFNNKGITAMKIQIIAPKETKQFFEFNPMLGYIQANSDFIVWVKVNANKELLTICQKYLTEPGVLLIPFQLIGADQVKPVDFKIQAKITIDTIQITPGKINFGRLYSGTASKIGLTCENLSDLPQKMIFYPLPKEISVDLDLIPLQILPKEKFQIDLIYRSTKPKGDIDPTRKDEGQLICKIMTGKIATKEIRIPYVADILKSPLEFSSMKIDMQVLQIDENINTTLQIKNSSSKDMIFEFFLPYFEICGLKMTPMVSRLRPNETAEIILEYWSFFKKLGPFTMQELQDKYENDPEKNFQLKMKLQREQDEEQKRQQQEQLEDNKAGGKDKKKAPEKKPEPPKKPEKLTKQQQQALEEEQRRQAELEKQRQEEELRQKQELERNFNVTAELAKIGGKLREFNNGKPSFSQHYTWLIPCYFKQVDTLDNYKSVNYIELTTVSVEKALTLNQTDVDFGEVAVGIRKTQELVIENIGSTSVRLRNEILGMYCGFSVINALRELAPGKTHGLVVQFQPHEEQPFEERLRIVCETTCVSAHLRGKGVRPEVKIQPEDGLLNISGVVLGEVAEKSFRVQNVSNFAIQFQILSIVHGIFNRNGSKVFSFIPQEGSIEAHKEIEVKIIFKPDRISEKFYELISIHVPNQKAEKQLFLWGACYPRSGYTTLYKPYLVLPKADQLNRKNEGQFDFLKIKDEETIFSQMNTKIVLEFTKKKKQEKPKEDEDQGDKAQEPEKDDPACTLRQIVIGNCKIQSDSKLEKPLNYEIIMPKDDKINYFSCDNIKGAVNAGSEIVISFTYKMPNQDQFIANIDALQGLGQWKELKSELKLSGGFLRPSVADVWSFEIILRAYVSQI